LRHFDKGSVIITECRSAEGKLDRQPDLASELVQLKVDVIVAAGGEPTARAAKQATQTIPIVMTNVGDPVVTGLVASLARAGGNVTGLVTMSPELSGKRLELLREAFSKISRVALFWNSANPEQDPQIKEINVAGQALGIQLQILEVRGKRFRQNIPCHSQGASRCDPYTSRSAKRQPGKTDRGLCGQEPVARNVPSNGICGRRRPNGLWAKL
jgi:ABC-type uncharacterized transport system substrate-binding protein